MRRRGEARGLHPGLPEPPGGWKGRGPKHGVGVFRWGLPTPAIVKPPLLWLAHVPNTPP